MTENTLNIKIIVKGCLNKNPGSQRKLYDLHFGFAVNIALRYTNNRDEAIEVVNDGFLKVFNHMDQFDPDYPFKPWLKKILINTAIDHYRKKRMTFQSLDFDQIVEPSETTPDFLGINSPNEVLAIIQELSPMYRTVFNLYVMEEYKHAEIAAMLDINISTSKSNLARAKAKLRTLWLRKNNSKNLKNKI